VIARLRAFGAFWYDFVVGDDWRIAAGIIVVLATGAVAVAAGISGPWLAPVLVVGFAVAFSLSIVRRFRARAS
jgi:hypothetical protein